MSWELLVVVFKKYFTISSNWIDQILWLNRSKGHPWQEIYYIKNKIENSNESRTDLICRALVLGTDFFLVFFGSQPLLNYLINKDFFCWFYSISIQNCLFNMCLCVVFGSNEISLYIFRWNFSICEIISVWPNIGMKCNNHHIRYLSFL